MKNPIFIRLSTTCSGSVSSSVSISTPVFAISPTASPDESSDNTSRQIEWWRGRKEWLGEGCDAFLCTHGCCSKSFGESTPHREAYRAHSSPNSPISPRLVKPPPLEGLPRHIVHQTIWDNAIPAPFGHLRFSRCVTSGRKSAFHALSAPDLSHQEMPNLPSRPLCGTFRFSRSITSGWKTAFHALLAPDVWHQEEI